MDCGRKAPLYHAKRKDYSVSCSVSCLERVTDRLGKEKSQGEEKHRHVAFVVRVSAVEYGAAAFLVI